MIGLSNQIEKTWSNRKTNMKKLLSGILLSSIFIALNAQVPNGDFENWKTNSSENPANWTTVGNVTKVDGSTTGAKALRMANNSTKGSFSIASIVNYDTGAFFAPAFDYNGTPDSVIIEYRSNLGPDTASVAIAFTKSGEDLPVSFAQIRIAGNSGGWVKRVFAVDYINPTISLTADSGYIVISSADEVFGPSGSGTLDIDQISFKYLNNAPAPVIPNFSFENWYGTSAESPDQWGTSHLMLNEQGSKGNFSSKTLDKYNGAFALELKGFITPDPNTGFMDTFPGMAITLPAGSSASDGNLFRPAFNINSRYTSFRGQYKTDLFSGDVAVVWANIFSGDSVVASAYFSDNQSHNSFIEFSADFTWDTSFTGVPEKATIALFVADSSFSGINSLKSRVVFDNLRFDNWNTSVIKTSELKSGVYPNPSSGKMALKIQSGLNTSASLKVFSTEHKLVYDQSIALSEGNNHSVIDLGHLSPGIYYLQLNNSNTLNTHKIIISR